MLACRYAISLLLFNFLSHKCQNKKQSTQETRINIERVKIQKTTLSQLNSLDKPFSEEEVKQSIKRLKNKKAAGLDRIRSSLFDHFSNKII